MAAANARMVYKSKISWGLVLFISLALGIPLVILCLNGVWPGVALILLTAWLPLSIFRNTYYEIKAGELLITCGFFFKQVVPVADIRSIRPTRNIIASPALSFDRQEVKFGKFDFVIISLKDEDKASFYHQLNQLNSNISIS